MSEIKDWRGTAIEVGDVILYAVKHSTSVEVNEAVVKEVGWEAPYYTDRKHPFVACEWQQSSYFYKPGRTHVARAGRAIKRVKLTNFEGITVVEKHMPPSFSRRLEVENWAEPKVV